MENHPIPQDVTGFQFKLIGNMTVKQFAYLAVGSVFAVIFYYAPVFLLLKLILIPLCAGAGAALAFLPIEGRPMDMMVSNFVRDLFTPTQYLYHKTGGLLPISMIELHPIAPQQTTTKHKKSHDAEQFAREVKLSQFLSQMAKKGKTKLDEKEELFLNALFNSSTNPHLLSITLDKSLEEHTLSEEEAMRVKLMQSPEDMEHELEKEAEAIKQELASTVEEEQQLESVHKQTTQVHTHVTDLEGQLSKIMEQKQQLEQELLKMREHMQTVKVKSAPDQPQQPPSPSQNIRIVPTDQASKVGMPALPDVPNIVMGIIRDPRGNVLPNILVEIKDKEGNPVRAFKTNGLGQFASATQLQSGEYTIEFEDPKGHHQFETVAIEAKGEIMLPFEIISHDAREQLRKELFS